MEKIQLDYPALHSVPRRAHVGVVGSGDLEVLLEPSPDGQAHVLVNTSVEGFGAAWKNVLDRFFAEYSGFNHFTQTVIRSVERGEVMRWPPRIGIRRPL